MKKKKETNTSQEPLDQHTPSKRFWSLKQKTIMSIESKSLPIQRTQRRNATILKFTPHRTLESPQKDSQLLGQVIGFDKNIKKLSLILYRSFTDQDLLYLAHRFKGLKSLKKLTLKLGSWVTDKGFYNLMRGLIKLCSLKSFSLDFYFADQISEVSLIYLRRSLEKMVFLKHVYLEFPQISQRMNKGMFRLNGSFYHIRRLEDVSFEISESSQMNDAILENLRFGRLASLRSICLDVAYCPRLTDKSISFLARGLKKVQNLKIVKLKFWECPGMSDLGLHYIWEMMKNLPSLQRITLMFSQSSKITDAGFYDMNSTLKCLNLLQKFRIEFVECPEITDDGLIDFCKVMEKAVSLENLDISFQGCSKITDRGMKKLVDCMNKFKHLRKIGIDFSRSIEITSVSLKNINQLLRSQTSLKKIRLCVLDMDGVTKQDVNDFANEIDHLKIKIPDLDIKYRN